jgi:predicted nucleic acid-binding protein
VRRGAIDATAASDVLADADSLAIDLFRIPPLSALVAAVEAGVTACDAAYWLAARARSGELVAHDRTLERAARA